MPISYQRYPASHRVHLQSNMSNNFDPRLQSNVVRVYLDDESFVTVSATPITTSFQLCQSIARKRNITSSALVAMDFCLFAVEMTLNGNYIWDLVPHFLKVNRFYIELKIVFEMCLAFLNCNIPNFPITINKLIVFFKFHKIFKNSNLYIIMQVLLREDLMILNYH